MDDQLKLRCIEYVQSRRFDHLDEWLEAFKWHLTCRILNNEFKSINEVSDILNEYERS